MAYTVNLMVKALKGLGRKIYHPPIKQQRLQTSKEVWRRGSMGKSRREDGIHKLFSKQQLEGSKSKLAGSGIPHATGRLLKKKNVLRGQNVNYRVKNPSVNWLGKNHPWVGHGKPLSPKYIENQNRLRKYGLTRNQFGNYSN